MRVPFQYAILRVVPRVERGESINAGVVVYCRDHDYLRALIELDTERLRALDRNADVAEIAAALQSIGDTCAGDSDELSGAEADIGRRFRWLTSPRSTVVQPGPVHTGLTDNPAADAERLLQVLVRAVDQHR